MKIIEFSKLSKSDRLGISETLFHLGIIRLGEGDDIVESYFKQLPIDIIKDGLRWGFNDTVVQENMHVWFEKNIIYEIADNIEKVTHKIDAGNIDDEINVKITYEDYRYLDYEFKPAIPLTEI